MPRLVIGNEEAGVVKSYDKEIVSHNFKIPQLIQVAKYGPQRVMSVQEQ
jgi:hypothetical protein